MQANPTPVLPLCPFAFLPLSVELTNRECRATTLLRSFNIKKEKRRWIGETNPWEIFPRVVPVSWSMIVDTRSARYWNFYEGVLIGREGLGWNSFWNSSHLDALIKFYLCFMRACVAYFSLVEREEFKCLRKDCYIIAYVRVDYLLIRIRNWKSMLAFFATFLRVKRAEISLEYIFRRIERRKFWKGEKLV